MWQWRIGIVSKGWLVVMRSRQQLKHVLEWTVVLVIYRCLDHRFHSMVAWDEGGVDRVHLGTADHRRFDFLLEARAPPR